MKSYHDVFPFLNKGQMLVSAWVAPPHKIGKNKNNFNTLEQYQLIKSLGLNTIYGLYENATEHMDEIRKAISYSNENQIHYLVRDQRIKDIKSKHELTDYAQIYMDLGASGILVEDEPGLIDFESLSRSYTLFNSVYKKQLFYVNLLPMHASSSQFTFGAWKFDRKADIDVDYKKYYDEYVKTLDLGYLSYDFYPFEGEFPNIRDDYFKQLEHILKITKEHQLIPICFIQTCSFNKHIRVPNETEMLWQVNTSIAYGTKGIQYFTYFLPEQNEHEMFKGALVDHEGKPTPLFSYVQNINQWIKEIETHIIDATLVSIEHINDLLITKFEKHDGSFEFMMNMSLIEKKKIDINSSKKVICRDSKEVLNPGEAILIFEEEN